MRKARKALLGCLCASALVAGSVAATVAYLTDSESVTNTFAVGQVGLSLDEASVDEYGVEYDVATLPEADNENRKIEVEGGAVKRVASNEYKLVPGCTYAKDPTVHFDAGSEASYLFVKLENGLSGIESASDSIDAQIRENGWEPLEGATGVYWKAAGKNDSDEAVDYVVFTKFTIDGDKATNENLKENYEGEAVVVTAYAVQQAGFGTAAEAWGATFGK